ncbi:MAG TPA: extracellular solute-binding protein, partial [Tepidisphaeraceae bacterium]|nr:extracellular solute-binding protein [Tepidisphaeraceae bacterium]
MSVARAIRILLVGCTLLLVVWAFFDVARRSYEEYRARTSRAVTLTVLHWGNPAETQIVESLVRRYERENPHVRILRIGVPGSGELASKLKTMVAAGDPPDVFYLAPDMLSEAARYKLVRPIDDYIAADRAAGVGAFYDDFFPLLLDAFRYDIEAQRVGQGPLYGLPKDFTTAIFYINVDLFEAAGVDYRRIQDEGWTWDEFADVTRRITDLNGRPPFVGGDRVFGSFFQLWPDTIRNIVWTYGGEFFGPGGFKDVALDSPQTKAALEMIARLRLKERTSYNPTGIAKDGGDEFLNGLKLAVDRCEP